MSATNGFQRILGVIQNFFQIGGSSGSGINNNAGTLEAKNAANSAFVNFSGAIPTLPQHFATKQYVDVSSKPFIAAAQFNGNNTLPSNSGAVQYYVVTTTGPNATIGQILYDNGTGTGTVTVISAAAGQEVVTTALFTGGTVTLQAQQNYVWTGSAWMNIAPSVAGTVYCVQVSVTTAATASSTNAIPAGAVIARVVVNVTTPFTAGATLSVGQTGSTSLLLGTTDINSPQVAGLTDAPTLYAWGSSALPVLVTVGGSPTAGAATVYVFYTTPLT